MTRKLLVLQIVVLLLLLTLASCAAPGGGAATPPGELRPTGTITYVAPDGGLSTPAVGSVTILALQGANGVFLRSLPDHASAIAGEVRPGDAGALLGVDPSGTWLLVKIKNQTGWVFAQLVDYTISN